MIYSQSITFNLSVSSCENGEICWDYRLLIIKFAKFELLTWHCSADISIWRRGGCGVRATLEGAEYKVVVEGECGRANGAGDEESSGGFWTSATGRG